ncbi:DUF2622 domain-containing protein [Providencia alcalifaciens]|uniref:DUF2622 domain-containing protein n=1 Tax=Providencia alcalifaciens TaxID=126385 RepID=UPI0032DAC13B
MANYIIRIEIYDADYNQYETLHNKMKALGFFRQITFSNKKNYDLPSGTYFGKSGFSTSTILSNVKQATKGLSSKDASIFLCQFTEWTASLYPSK